LPIGTSGQILSVSGGFPAWTSLSGSVVTSFSGGSSGLTPVSPTTGAISLAGTLNTSNGGTGLATTPTNGQLLIGNGSNYTLSTVTAGSGISVVNASGSITLSVSGAGAVTSFQTSLSGLTPSTATPGAITLAGTLGAVSGGTGYSSYTAGDTLYANTATTFSKLGIGANNTVLTSNGSAPQYVAQSTLSVGSATNISGGATGSVPYNTSAGATSFLALGTTNNVLTAGVSAPQYVAQSTLSVGSSAAVALSAGSGATNYLVFAAAATGNASEFTNTALTYNYTNNAITGGIQGGGF
jgi:hypothetical protein